MNKIVEFKREHLEAMDIRQHELDVAGKARLDMLAISGQCWTYIRGDTDTIVAVFGFYEMWHGVIEVFLIPSRQVAEFGISFARLIRRSLDRLMIDMELQRMETRSLADEQTDRWMQYLGFVCEGTNLRYTVDGHDYRMWARYG